MQERLDLVVTDGKLNDAAVRHASELLKFLKIL